jgi:type III pantothenate kinase
MSDWAFDLGNTRLKLAPLGPGGVGTVSAFAHDGQRLDPAWLGGLPPRIEVAWVASVGPAAVRADLLQALVPRAARVVEVRVEREMGGIRIGYDDPARLGIDRALAMVGACVHATGPVLVVGVGTALTLDLVDGEGRHLGGCIAPSPTLMREALHVRAPVLPPGGGRAGDFGTSTEDALAAGCTGAALGLVSRSMEAAAARLGTAPELVVHGGGAAALLPALGRVRHQPSLVLDGLARLARHPPAAG